MDDDPHRIRREQREATDRYIVAMRQGLDQLEVLSSELSRSREIEAEVRAMLPADESGDVLREWLDSHDTVYDELQATCDVLRDALETASSQVAATELYLHELQPQDDPRTDG